jgi:hypothetical protein
VREIRAARRRLSPGSGGRETPALAGLPTVSKHRGTGPPPHDLYRIARRAAVTSASALAPPTEREELRHTTRQRLPVRPAMQHSGAADGRVSSAISQIRPGCKQKSGSVGAVDQTAGAGAKRQSAPHGCI